MSDLQKTFASNMKANLLLEVESLKDEMSNPKSRPAKNKQRAKAIEAKLEAIRQCDIILGVKSNE